MTDSIHKQIVDKIAQVLAAIGGGITVETNTVIPDVIPDAGLIIVRDIVNEPTVETLGGFDPLYCTGVMPLEVFVSDADDATRDGKYDALLQSIGTALQADRKLGGLTYGLIIDRPEAAGHDIVGAAAVKACTIKVHIEYEAPGALT
jgi:hypothetical protein